MTSSSSTRLTDGTPSQHRHIRPMFCALFLIGVATLSACARQPVDQMKTSDIFADPQVAALAVAAETGDVNKIDALVGQGVDVNAKGQNNITPLVRCLLAKNMAGYDALLRHKADPNLLDDKGRAVMFLAAQEKNPEWLRKALEHAGDPNLINRGNRNRPNSTPIFYAIASNLPENARLLIAARADLDHKNSFEGNPLYDAVENADFQIAYLLVEAGADFRQKCKESDVLNILSGYDPSGLFRQEEIPWFSKLIELLNSKGANLK